ncbi:Yip1 family protein [Alteromonas sp. AMM-1]|uniref:Yip1 family protein n=1 Tax=Alteromonas sp. AMM-1 TaxID=3394233 RepID=UPI0039A591EA
MSEVTNPIQACNDIFFKPNGVFKAVNEHNNWSWVPFLIVIVLSVLPGYLFINFVDFSWYQNMLIDTQYGEMSPAEQDQMRMGMQQSAIQMFMLIGGILGPIVVNAVVALYLHLMTKSDEQNLNGFTDWYGFTWWASMPAVINALLAIALIALSENHQVLPTIISPLSVAYWADVQMSSEWFGFAQSLRLESLWTIYLIAVGIAQWTSFSTKKATIIACAPFAVIWAIWLVVNLI